MSHLSINAKGKPLLLPADFSLDIEFKNPMFNDIEAFSYPVQIPLTGNRHLVQNIEDRKSAMRPVSIEHTSAEILTEGFQLFKGEITTSEEEEVADSLSFNIDGSKTLKSLIQDLDCKDIPVKDNICIGEKITGIAANCQGDLSSKIEVEGNIYNSSGQCLTAGLKMWISLANNGQMGVSSFTPQALGFSVPYKCVANNPAAIPEKSKDIATDVDGYIRIIPTHQVSFINVTDPYPTAKYCNARVAYKNYALNSSGETDSGLVPGSPYKVLDADRPQSGICFYVLYFLDCLFDYLGLEWDNSELLKIEDLKRLCFYTTKCKYDEETISERTDTDFTYINNWLKSRGCGAELSVQNDNDTEAQTASAPVNRNVYVYNPYISFGDSKLESAMALSLDNDGSKNQKIYISASSFVYDSYLGGGGEDDEKTTYPAGVYTIKCSRVNAITNEWKNFSFSSVKSGYGYMYANSENFPETTVTTIIESLENQFGIRFIYDAEAKKVSARLLRDMYRSKSTPHAFLGSVDSMTKIAEKITGVRCCYASESTTKEQRNNLRDRSKDYDTNYDYIDYPNPDKVGMAGTAAARTTDTSKSFADIVNRVSNTDNTCYIDVNTGNAYRIKVDSETNKSPRWFEVGAFKGVEFGDCSVENEDYVREMASNFEPLILSDVAYPLSATTHNVNLVAFCDEDMEHEYVKQYLDYPIDVAVGSVYVRAELRLEEAYDVSNSDDGNSPLQTYDWGNAIAIMRGGGTDATTQLFDAGYDGFANFKWRQVAGDYSLTTDSIDQYGNQYDYNGNAAGVLAGERFSLKPRAYKGWLCPWASSALCNADQRNNGDASNNNQPWYYYIRNRGWVDRFLFEHANFLLDRRKFKVLAKCSAASVADIKNHWTDRWNIDGEIGYIDTVKASISAITGISQVELTFYAI